MLVDDGTLERREREQCTVDCVLCVSRYSKARSKNLVACCLFAIDVTMNDCAVHQRPKAAALLFYGGPGKFNRRVWSD
jgi:hypothetical protein